MKRTMVRVQVVREKSLPFDPLMPNTETVEAMQAARRSETVKVGKLDGLIASLNAEPR